MLKRFGASSKHQKAAGALKSSAIVVTDQPETDEEEPASIIENNKVTPDCKDLQWQSVCAAYIFTEEGFTMLGSSPGLLSSRLFIPLSYTGVL